MRKKRSFILNSTLSILLILFITPMAKANPDPVNVSWYVTDANGTPLDGASITIYWATYPSGPFTIMPADDENTYVQDKLPQPNIKRNPIFTGYWNPDYPHGMAVCDIHPSEGLDGLYFYVEISYNSVTWYWPTAQSQKPGDSSWAPVAASGSPTGCAAYGPEIGTGPTTAYPTSGPPTQVIPEIPLGSVLAAATIIGAFGAFHFSRKRKRY